MNSDNTTITSTDCTDPTRLALEWLVKHFLDTIEYTTTILNAEQPTTCLSSHIQLRRNLEDSPKAQHIFLFSRQASTSQNGVLCTIVGSDIHIGRDLHAAGIGDSSQEHCRKPHHRQSVNINGFVLVPSDIPHTYHILSEHHHNSNNQQSLCETSSINSRGIFRPFKITRLDFSNKFSRQSLARYTSFEATKISCGSNKISRQHSFSCPILPD